MGNFNKSNIDFSRQTLLEKITRPAPIFALYPRNTGNTTLQIRVQNNTTIEIRYLSSGSPVNLSIQYPGKTVQAVAQEINESNIPLKVVSFSDSDVLKSGDVVQLGASYLDIPSSFNVHDRSYDRSVLIRGRKATVRHKNTSNIKVLPPYNDQKTLPWYPRILNGSFTQKYKNRLYHFYIPEYDRQSWSANFGKPFKDILGAVPKAIDKYSYSLPRAPIYWNGENITIYNQDIPLNKNVIKDIDINNGILYLDPQVDVSDDFTVDYVYLENSYIYKDININGHFSQNPLILDKFVLIYMLPVEASTSVNKRTIYHVIGDSIESAIDSIEIADPEVPIAIIGAYNVQQVFSSDLVNIFDTRSKGGGLKKSTGPKSPVFDLDNPIESNDVEIESIYQESYRFWDIGNIDGQPYPAAAAVSMELPAELREVLPLADIKKRASKHLAAGVYPSISFYEQELPAIEGLSRQVSCTYNLDLSEIFTKTLSSSDSTDLIIPVKNTIPSTFTGAGWISEKSEIPGSILTADWSQYQPLINIKNTQGQNVIEVALDNGVGFSYLKGSPIAGISWYERDVVSNDGDTAVPVVYSNWTKKTILDTKTVNSGELVKQYFYIKPENVIKQYKDFTVHSPYHPTDLKTIVSNEISSIVDTVLTLQTTGFSSATSTPFSTAIGESYSDIIDRELKQNVPDYVLSPSYYNSFFNLEDTPLEDKYYEKFDQIGKDVLKHAIITSGHYFKYFVQSSKTYNVILEGGPTTLFQFNDQIKFLNKYLHFRNRKGTWEADCNTGITSVLGLTSKMMASSSSFGNFGPAIPTYWYYFPINTASGILVDYLSGYYIPTVESMGTTYSEIDPNRNYEYLYTESLPAILSTALANTGELISNSTTLSNIATAYSYAVNSVVNKVDEAINQVRYYSGLPTASHWFIGHNKLGTYLGTNLKNIIEGYEYLYKYNATRENIYDIRYPSNAGPLFLDYIFSGIENILDTSYDVVYNNLLRQGITEPETAYTIYAYGWYVNNWLNHNGMKGQTFTSDNRSKYYRLFSNGLKQLVKNQFSEDGKFLEIKSIFGEPGPFAAYTPSKILYPIAEALKIDKSRWEGLAEGVVTTIARNYGVSGLYYADPYYNNTVPGREQEFLNGYINIYKALSPSGTFNGFEPVNSKLKNVRGCKFAPNFTAYYDAPPTGDWEGVTNTLAFWKYYSSGDVESSITNLKSIGINTLYVDLDYILWKTNSGDFFNKLDHLVETCVDNKVSIIPNLLNDKGITVTESSFNNYINSFGHTGGMYRPEVSDFTHFMTGTFSGEQYVSGVVNRYKYSPAVISWSIVSNPISTGTNLMNYSSMTYIADSNTTLPLIYNLANYVSAGDLNGTFETVDAEGVDLRYYAVPVYSEDIYASSSPIVNPRVDIIGLSPNPTFEYFLNRITTFSKDYILTNYGNSAFGDYSSCILWAFNRAAPIILSDVYVKSGSYEGFIYDNLDCRISRHAISMQALAQSQNVISTGKPIQVIDFSDKYFYPNGYIPSYNGSHLLYDLLNWNNRPNKTPLSSYNTGEFQKQTVLLEAGQAALDSLNSLVNPDIYSSNILTEEEKLNLNAYRTSWSTGNFFVNPSYTWTLSGEIDSNRYDTFISNWGLVLKGICERLRING